MARPRIKQFADDMGISYNRANSLINEGRRRQDAGTSVVERHMDKMKKGRKEDALDKLLRKMGDPDVREADRLSKMARELPPHRQPDLSGDRTGTLDQSKRRKSKERTNFRSGGLKNGGMGSGSCRGTGAAVRGTSFSGIK